MTTFPGVVGNTEGKRMLRRLGEPDRLGFVRGRLGKSAELGKAPDQPGAIEDRCRRHVSEILVDPVGGQHREVVGGQLDHPLVLAPVVMRLLEIRRGEDAESQVPEAPGDLQRAGTGYERLVQLAKQRVDGRHESGDLASPAVVVQPLGEGLTLAQALQHPPDFAELVQHLLQLETDLEGLLQGGPAFRQRLESAQRLLKPDPGVRSADRVH